MDSAFVPIIASAVGGLMVLLPTIINNRFQLQRDQKQWEREQKRRETERLYELYQECLVRLTRLPIGFSTEKEGMSVVQVLQGELSEPLKSYIELHSYMHRFLERYPNQSSSDFKDLKQDINDYLSQAQPDIFYAGTIKNKLVKLMEGEKEP
ncbi:hypothetical protein BZZ01_11505 [Nostocales cyanobacterium HT-58-2]|nr:hypothetical protein BZZ01_11505 [Nostocales cyanobacterium HT-58-2]